MTDECDDQSSWSTTIICWHGSRWSPAALQSSIWTHDLLQEQSGIKVPDFKNLKQDIKHNEHKVIKRRQNLLQPLKQLSRLLLYATVLLSLADIWYLICIRLCHPLSVWELTSFYARCILLLRAICRQTKHGLSQTSPLTPPCPEDVHYKCLVACEDLATFCSSRRSLLTFNPMGFPSLRSLSSGQQTMT